MKRTLVLLLASSMLLACNAKAPTPPSEKPIPTNPKILVAYFSRAGENHSVGVVEVGNTQKMAEEIARQTGGSLFRIQTVKPYSENYKECAEEAKKELQDKARPKLTEQLAHFDRYETIYLGYPVWYGTAPMAVYTFIESYDWKGKHVYPFATHEGSGMDSSENKLKKVLPSAIWHPGLSLFGHTAQNEPTTLQNVVRSWLQKDKLKDKLKNKLKKK